MSFYDRVYELNRNHWEGIIEL